MEKLLLGFDSKINFHKKYLGYIKISKLITNKIIISSEIQRLLDTNIIDNIIKYQTDYFNSNGKFNFLGVINIHYCKENDILFLVDGQHRYEAIKKLHNELQRDIVIGIELNYVENFINLKNNYEIINKNTPLPQFPTTIDKNIPESVAKKIRYNFHNSIWSNSQKVQRPNINFGHFQESLAVLTDKLNINKSTELYDMIEEYNTKLKNQDSKDFPGKPTERMLIKCKKTNFYLGLYKHISNDGYGYKWVEEIINSKSIKVNEKNKKNKPKTKKKIPKRIKDESWNTYVGKDKTKGLCVCCRKEEIRIQNFTAGHINSEKNGGEITVDNIIPICQPCNLSMGITNMEIFILKHFPKNITYFKNKDYSYPSKHSILSKIFKKN